jgi:hypothetical protein
MRQEISFVTTRYTARFGGVRDSIASQQSLFKRKTAQEFSLYGGVEN